MSIARSLIAVFLPLIALLAISALIFPQEDLRNHALLPEEVARMSAIEPILRHIRKRLCEPAFQVLSESK